MNNENLEQLLKQTDMDHGSSVMNTDRLSLAVRHKFKRQRQIHRSMVTACAAIILVATFYSGHIYQMHQKQQQIARMQQEIQQLTQQTEATLKLVDEILMQQKQQDKIVAMNRRLATYTSPLRSVQTQVNEAVSVLMFQADRLMEQSDRQDAAIEGYQRIIEYFPQTDAAQTAQQRLRQIQQAQTNSI